MNSFVLIACAAVLLSCAHARPDVSLGYHYHPDHTSGGASDLSAPDFSSYNAPASGGSYYTSQPSAGQFESSGFNPSFGAVRYGVQSNSGGSSFSQTTSVVNEAPVVTKNFYLHTVPEEHDEQDAVRYVTIGRPQNNYRVVFIDSGSITSSKAKIVAKVAPTEEKTAVYVLSKDNHGLDVQTEVVTAAPVNNKPEVFFIKYKTPEEAIHAQHTIQAQYDALGGTSESHNEGPIPVSSVIGSLGGSGGDDAGHADNGGEYVAPVEVTHTGTNTQTTYLPANHK
ncbi:uncharacterized protein [Musca autumnalis]|uniref:uncharacterized protein n=1 Tax=Musca autumnalis TaxID=221902 RepID=UPI003CEF8E19